MAGTIAMTVSGVIVFGTYLYWILATRHWMKRAIKAEAIAADHAAIADELSKIQGFLHACRLLAVHRNGRVNVFTFARGEQVFAIETMGLLSDNPDEWRRQAGLIE